MANLLDILSERVVLGDGSAPNSLYANGGTALVIHAKGDDNKSDPAGNAGDRIACFINSALEGRGFSRVEGDGL